MAAISFWFPLLLLLSLGMMLLTLMVSECSCMSDSGHSPSISMPLLDSRASMDEKLDDRGLDESIPESLEGLILGCSETSDAALGRWAGSRPTSISSMTAMLGLRSTSSVSTGWFDSC